MRRLIALFTLIAPLVQAQTAPDPAAHLPSTLPPATFSFDTAFTSCIATPEAEDLMESCTARISASYVLKREIAAAVAACGTEPLSTCAAPFEARGLPAFGAQIAHSIACETTDPTSLPTGTHLSPDHCISITADILSDEGAVPLNTDIDCGGPQGTCIALAEVHRQLWQEALMKLDNGPQNDPTSRNLFDLIGAECSPDAASRGTENGPNDTDFTRGDIDCATGGMIDLWRDLVLEH